MSRRVGLFGGSFDPIHAGHVEPVLAAMRLLRLDRVVYLPTGRPPHKLGRRLAPAHRRFAMCELALLDHPALEVATWELDETRPSYTVDTLLELRRRRPELEPVLLVGSDAFAGLASWREWRRILELAELGVLGRPGATWESLFDGLDEELRQAVEAAQVELVAGVMVDVSATAIRDSLAAGAAPPPGTLDPRVLDYVRKYGLYRTTREPLLFDPPELADLVPPPGE